VPDPVCYTYSKIDKVNNLVDQDDSTLQGAEDIRYIKTFVRIVADAGQHDDGRTDRDPRTELDSHADTCLAGRNFLKVATTGRTVTVSGYGGTTHLERNIPIVTAATVWRDDQGNDYSLVVNEALYFGDTVPDSLLNPNQLRSHGLRVEDVPRQFDNKSSHSIHVPDSGLTIPLTLSGVMSGFTSRKPTWLEWEVLPRIELTSIAPWTPHLDTFARAEEYAVRHVASARSSETQENSSPNPVPDAYFYNETRQVAAVRSICSQPVELDDEDIFHSRLVASISVAADDGPGDGIDGHTDADVYPVRNEDIRKLGKLSTTDRRSVLTPEVLSRRWGIGLETARRTLTATTQSGIRNVLMPGERKVRQRLDHLRYPSLKGHYYTDTMFATTRMSLRGHKTAQVFTNGYGYDRFYPMRDKKGSSTADALMQFIHDEGIPQVLISDNANEQVGDEFAKVCRHHHINRKMTVPYSPWRNLAEASVRELKVSIRRMLRRHNAPRRLWCFAGERAAAIRRLTAHDIPSLNGRTSLEAVKGSTPDISSHALFDFYEPVRYLQPEAVFPFEKKKIGYVLSAFEPCLDELAFYVLTETGRVVIRKSLWALSPDDLANPQVQADLAELDKKVKSKIGDNVPDSDLDTEFRDMFPEAPDDMFDDDPTLMPYHESPDEDSEEPEEYTPEAYDEYIAASILLPQGGELQKATVVNRKHDRDGLPIGRRHANPLLDTREYEVQFPDGSTDTFNANIIAENLYSQVDSEGRSFAVMKEIVDHRTNGHALTKDDGFTTDKNGRRHPKLTTRGWELQVEWKDGSTDWIPLKDLKQSNPIEVAEYAVTNKLVEEPAFAWWVREALRRRDRIIGKVASRYWKRTHKYGVEIPKSVEEALAIDKRTGTDCWRRAIEKEMTNVRVAFEFRDDNVMPVGYKKIDCHMIFDVKMVGLVRKARLVAGGHMTDEPKDSTYSSVVSRDSVRIAFLLAALNDLEVLSADVQNAYLNAPTKEKVYTIAGLEFGATNAGRPVMIVRALYGLKSSGARWRDHMADTLRHIGFKGCYADPDVWMRPATKPDGTKYYEYVLIYVDDALVVSHDPKSIMTNLSDTYTLKEGSVKEPDMYLGAEIKKYYLKDSDDPQKTRWAISSDLYVKKAIADVETELAQVDKKLVTKASTPLSAGYRPEMDLTPLLGDKQASYFQGLIGVLRWICELGRIDIILEVSLMSRYLAAPRQGHLEQVFHIFAYLKRYDRSSIVMDDNTPTFDQSRFTVCDWSEYYPGAAEVLPPNAPEPRGKGVTMTCFVDADHAGCLATRRSHTGILIFVNRAPILWYSKRQNTVETSTFGSEFVAAKIAVEMVEGLRYKLRMMGVEIHGPTDMFGDNQSVVVNATKPESVLKKKHNAIAYHRVREAQAAGYLRFAHEPGETNLADILTKPLPGPRKRELSQKIMR
jgi:Reverse transcriptase (RNA-dependent DNA polymerase)